MLNFKAIEGTYLIAEIGINHNADLQITKKLIDAAFACSWDCVKFQKRNPDACVPEEQKQVIKETPWGAMTYLEYKKRMEFGKKEYAYIDGYCRQKPIDWTASVWDLDSLKFISGYEIPFIKIPSAKITDHGLIKEAARVCPAVMLSTGMSTLEEVDEAVKTVSAVTSNYILMHTNSTYPAVINELNLNCIPELKKRYGCAVGYSGHEYSLEPTVYAAVLGARVIERHITLDHNLWGSDQKASIEPMGMDMLKKRVRSVDAILGDGVKRLMPSEEEMKKKLRGATPGLFSDNIGM